MGQQRPAVLAQIDGVEVLAPGEVEVGQLPLVEVVGEAVDVQHRTSRRAVGAAPYQRRDHRALPVVGQLQDQCLVGFAEDVGPRVGERDRGGVGRCRIGHLVWHRDRIVSTLGT